MYSSHDPPEEGYPSNQPASSLYQEQSDTLDEEYQALSFPEKMKHKKWQIRRRVYMELHQHLLKESVEEQEESLGVWTRDMANENNLIAFQEALLVLQEYTCRAKVTK